VFFVEVRILERIRQSSSVSAKILSKLPTVIEISEVNYNVSSDNTVYRFIIRAKSKGIEREFVYSSDGNLTEDDYCRDKLRTLRRTD